MKITFLTVGKTDEAYLKDVDAIYVTDAYHSLSIERYKVTPELIERVSSGTWDAAIALLSVHCMAWPLPGILVASVVQFFGVMP